MNNESGQVSSGAAAVGRRPRVLIVEDYEPNRMVAEFFLNQLGVETEAAADGESALEKIGAKGCDVVLLDLVLPGMDGLQLVQRVRELHGPGAPEFVVMTSRTAPEELMRAHAAGLGGLLEKPFGLEQLFDVLRQVLPEGLAGALAAPPNAEVVSVDAAWDEALFDHHALVKMLNNRPEVLALYVKGFWEHCALESERLRKALGQSDTGPIREVVHNWSGAAGYLKARPLLRALRPLAEAARAGDMERARGVWPSVERQLQMLLGGLKVFYFLAARGSGSLWVTPKYRGFGWRGRVLALTGRAFLGLGVLLRVRLASEGFTDQTNSRLAAESPDFYSSLRERWDGWWGWLRQILRLKR